MIQQIAVILIVDKDEEARPRLEGFQRAPVEFRGVALANSAHHTKNSLVLLTELGLGHIARFLQVREAAGHPERMGAPPANHLAGAFPAGQQAGAQGGGPPKSGI